MGQASIPATREVLVVDRPAKVSVGAATGHPDSPSDGVCAQRHAMVITFEQVAPEHGA